MNFEKIVKINVYGDSVWELRHLNNSQIKYLQMQI